MSRKKKQHARDVAALTGETFRSAMNRLNDWKARGLNAEDEIRKLARAANRKEDRGVSTNGGHGAESVHHDAIGRVNVMTCSCGFEATGAYWEDVGAEMDAHIGGDDEEGGDDDDDD